MPLFFVLACLLVVAALVVILPSALRSRSEANDADQEELDQLETNITIAKERRRTLAAALESGAMDEATYATEVADLENALAMDLSAKQSKQESSRSAYVIAGLIAIFLPISAGALYLKLGTPKGIDTEAAHEQAIVERQQQQATNNQPPALAELLPNLEKKLEANPDDRNGWKLLGKSYLTVNKFADAKRALLRAYELGQDDPDLLAQLAEATAVDIGGDLAGKPTEYLDAALTLDPDHQQSLWLKAIATQQAGNHEEALERFNKLREGVAGNADALASIDAMSKQSEDALGISTTAPSKSLSLTVDLAQNAKADVKPTDSVFIFARASTGPPMPLAVSRHTVSELPVSVVLDDSMAMMPEMTLSNFPSVTVSARVSKTGDAIAQPGDWFTELNDVIVDEAGELTLTIDTKK